MEIPVSHAAEMKLTQEKVLMRISIALLRVVKPVLTMKKIILIVPKAVWRIVVIAQCAMLSRVLKVMNALPLPLMPP